MNGSFAVTVEHNVQIPEGAKVELFHIHNGKAELVENAQVEEGKVTFVTDGFSEYVIRYTVDFHYGEEEVSIEGETQVLLSALIKQLGIKNENGEFIDVANVASVSFSDERLVTVEEVSGEVEVNGETVDVGEKDFLLTSKEPFTSREQLILTMIDESEVVVCVTDEQALDITSLLTGVSITENGTPVASDATLIKDKVYDIKLSFQETDSLQFVDDNAEMYYTLPSNITVPNDSGTFDMEFGAFGKVQGNTYSIENGVLKIHWNTSDPNMGILRALDEAHFDVNIKVKFGENSKVINWNEHIQTNVDVIEAHDANVSKVGNYDATTGKIYYTVTVNSTGTTTDIKVTDEITGSALTSDVTSLSDLEIKNKNGQVVTAKNLTVNGNKFVLELPDMTDGDQYIIKYSASVNYGELGKSGKTTYLETNNGVKVEWGESPDPKEDNSYEYDIYYSSLSKGAQSVSDVYEEEGKKYRDLTWRIEANGERKVPVSHITDTIRSDSTDIMEMYGTGLTVVVNKEDGTSVTREIPWGNTDATLGTIVKTDTSWTYYPPNSDGNASYQITYKTRAEVTALEKARVVNNDVEDDWNQAGGGASVGPDGEVTITKTATSVSESEVTWNIDVSIPKNGTSQTRIVDVLPVGNGAYWDKYKDCTVTGLDTSKSEGYDVTFLFRHYTDQWNFTTYEAAAPTDSKDFEVEVYLNFYHIDDQGNKVSGFAQTGAERNIHVEFITENDPDWLDAAAADVNTFGNHKNTVKFGDLSADSTVQPSHKKISKELVGKTEVTIGGVTYPAYQYKILLQGITDGRQQIFDTFDTDVFEILTVDDNTAEGIKSAHGGIGHGDSIYVYGVNDTHRAILTPTNDGILISTTELDKTATGAYYACYRIDYFLIMKDQDKAAKKAFDAGGKTTFTNSVNWDGATSHVDIEYGHPILDKQVAVNDTKTKAHYTITINPDKMSLGATDGVGHYPAFLTLTDTFSSSLSIVYDSISVTVDDVEDTAHTVEYDYSGNVGTFKVPNNKKVVISYDCNIIKNDKDMVQIWNDANLNGDFESRTEQYVDVSTSASGGGELFAIKLLKYKENHMEAGPLAGATFRILDSEKNPIVVTARAKDPNSHVGDPITFTTDASSAVTILLSRYTHGVTLKKNTVYYLEEIEAPAGYQLDPTLYSFVISDDPNHANYTREDGVWVYYVGDILKVRNTPEKQQLTLYKRFEGNVTLTDEQKQNIEFTVIQVDKDGIEVANGFRKVIKYTDLRYDKYTITTEQDDGFGPGYYKVIEEHADATSLGLSSNVVSETSYSVTTNGTTVTGTSNTVNSAQVVSGKGTNVIFVNKYSTGAYYFNKIEAGTEEQPLGGAEFTVYDTNNSQITVYTTGEDGKFMISRQGGDESLFNENTLYYVMETKAPAGYSIPDPAPKYYFFFGDGDPTHIPEGATENNAVNLYEGSRTENIINASDTSVMVEKVWVHKDGSAMSDTETKDLEAHVTLRRKISRQVGAKVTINITDNSGTKSVSKLVKLGSDVKLEWKLFYDSTQLTIDEHNILDNSNGSYTLTNVQENTAVYVASNGWNGGAFNAMQLDFTPATFGDPEVDTTYNSPQTLTLADGWYYAWDKLDKTDADGNPYTYYITEEQVPEGYQLKSFTNNDGIQSGTITVTNEKKEDEKGSVKVKKAFEGITAEQLPANFQIVASWNDGTAQTRTLKITGGTSYDDVEMTGTFPNYEWTISDLPLDTEVTFTETGMDVAGYSVTANGAANATTATASATVAKTPGEATFTNVYTPKTGSVTFTQKKVFTNGNQATVFGYTITEYTDSTYGTVKSVITSTGSMSANADGVTAVSYAMSDVGDHYYIVKENLPAGTTPTADDTKKGYIIVDGVKYDLNEHQYVVNVSEGDTALVVKKDTVEVTNIDTTFNNEQLGKLTVTKSLALNPADDGNFQTTYQDKKYTVTITTGEAPNVKYLKADGTLSDKEVSHTVSNATPLVIENVPAGTYTVTELETGRVITGYKFDGVTGDPTDFTAAIAGDEKTVALTNTYEESKTDIHILKVKDDGTTALDGATFSLTKTGGDQTFESQTTANGGKADFTGLKAGTYTLSETDVPADYKGITGDITFNLTENDGVFTLGRTDSTADVTLANDTFTFTVKNRETTDIKVTKEWKNSAREDHTSNDDDTITFTLHQVAGETDNELATGLVVKYQKDGSYAYTNAMGSLVEGGAASGWGTTSITGLPKYTADGTAYSYYVVETAVSENGVTIETSYKVGTGEANGTASSVTVQDDTNPIVIVNQDMDTSTSIKIVKVDAHNNTTKLNGATFELKRVKDGEGNDVAEQAVSQITSGEDETMGTATFGNLQAGIYELTETQSPAGYKTTFEKATFTVSRSGNNMTVTYTDETGGIVTYNADNQAFTVTNEPLVDIDATKTWKQNVDDAGDLNATITNAEVTYTLYRKIGDGEWDAATDVDDYQVTLKVENAANADAWKARWTGLDKYSRTTEIQYKVVESDAKVNGEAITLPDTAEVEATEYNTVDGHTNPTAVIGLTNTLPKTSISVVKSWKDTSTGKTTPPTGAKATLGLYVETTVETEPSAGSMSPDKTYEPYPDQANQLTVEVDGEVAQDYVDETTGENAPWTALFANLPKYDANGKPITYMVKEESTQPAGMTFKPVYDGDEGKVAATSTVENRYTSFRVQKRWMSNGTTWNPDYPADTIYYKLAKIQGTAVNTIQVIDTEARTLTASKTIKVAKANLGQDATLVKEKFPDDDQDGLYVIPFAEEISPLPILESGWSYCAVECKSDGTPFTTGTEFWTCNEFNGSAFAIKNDLTDVTAKKTWDDKGNTVNHPAVTFKLYRTTETVSTWSNENGYTAPANWGAAVYTATIPANATGEALTVKWSDLPKYDIATGLLYTYKVEEETVPGYTLKARGLDGRNKYAFTFENELDTTELNVEKKWEINGEDATEDQLKTVPKITYQVWREAYSDSEKTNKIEEEDITAALKAREGNGITGQLPIVTPTGEEPNQETTYAWTEAVKDLPTTGQKETTTTNDNGTPDNDSDDTTTTTYETVYYKYYIVEEAGDLYPSQIATENELTHTHTLTNKLVDAEVTKLWQNVDGHSVDPENGTQIEVTLKKYAYHNNAPLGDAVVVDTITMTYVESGTEKNVVVKRGDTELQKLPADNANAWKYEWKDLAVDGTAETTVNENQVEVTVQYHYQIVETVASSGYNRATGESSKVKAPTAKIEQTITNVKNPSFELPSTGGPGTTGLYIVGSILTLLALVLLITKKRTEGQGID